MKDTAISIIMAVHNGEKWLPAVLDSLKNQTYPRNSIELIVLDNGSQDGTNRILLEFAGEWKYPRGFEAGASSEAGHFLLRQVNDNAGFWAGFERMLPQARGEYVIALTDVVLDPRFIERAVAVMEEDKLAGALQAKIYQFDSALSTLNSQLSTRLIDTCGFRIQRSRRVTNLGHGERDTGQFDRQEEIFAVEGAVPVFRRSALEDCIMQLTARNGQRTTNKQSWLVDPDFRVGSLGYGDDLDLAWRMRLFGWKQIFAPDVIAYHDRSTTRGLSRGWRDYISRIKIRRKIPIQKRRLDWSNVRFTIIKNDYIINILRDLPYILFRELGVLGYTLIVEPEVLPELKRFFRLLPKMLRKRTITLRRARADAKHMGQWME